MSYWHLKGQAGLKREVSLSRKIDRGVREMKYVIVLGGYVDRLKTKGSWW